VSESITTTPAEGTIPARRRDDARPAKSEVEGAIATRPEDAPIAARTDGAGADAEPAPGDDGAGARASEAGAPRGGRWMYVARLMLAPVLAAGAVGVHWALNVPAHISVSAKDQGAKKNPKKKPSRKSAAVKPRPPGEIEATWKRYEEWTFDEEPVRSTWVRTAQSLVNKTVVVARKHAFEGAPEEPRVSVLDVRCKTIRCRFVLRSPYPHEIDLLIATLEQVQIDGASIWLGFEHERIEPPKENLPKDETYVQVTIGFTADDLDDADMNVGEDIAGGAADTEDPLPE
jgi:hypothetical protein